MRTPCTQVAALAGERDAHHEIVRWGQQQGSVYPADQQLPLKVPRVHEVFGTQAHVQRGQRHQRENVVSYWAKRDPNTWRPKRQAAWRIPSPPMQSGRTSDSAPRCAW